MPKQQFNAAEFSAEQVKIATTKSIRRNFDLRTNAEEQVIEIVNQTEALLKNINNWRRSVYAVDADFLAFDLKVQGAIIHRSVSNQMRQLDVAELNVNVNQRLYGINPYNSPVTGLPYEYTIPDYYHTLDNAILEMKPLGTPLSGPQFNDFKNFAKTNDVCWIYCQRF